MLRKALCFLALLLFVGLSGNARVRVKLTKAMYNNPYCALDLCNVYATNIYGHPSVPAVCYADLADYEALVVEVAEGTPRFLFNRVNDDAQAPEGMISIPNDADQTEAYQTVEDLEDGKKAYIINLTKIKNDWNVVRLNAIKGADWKNVIVTRMYLVKPLPVDLGNNTPSYTNELNANEIRVTPRYKFGTKNLTLEELPDAENGFFIRSHGRLLLTDDLVPKVNGTEKTRIYNNFSDDNLFLSWRFKMDNNGVTDNSIGVNKSSRFMLYDAYSDYVDGSMSSSLVGKLGYMCASPYAHVWITNDENEAHRTEAATRAYEYPNGKTTCENGTSWVVNGGTNEYKSEGELRGQIFLMVTADEKNMAYFLPEVEGAKNDQISVDPVVKVVDDGSTYRIFSIKFHSNADGLAQYTIRVQNANDQYKTGWNDSESTPATYLQVGNVDRAFVGRIDGNGHQMAADIDWGGLWNIGYEDDKGFWFRSRAHKDGRMWYLREDGQLSAEKVYWRCIPANALQYNFTDSQIKRQYSFLNVGVRQGNFNVNCSAWQTIDGISVGQWQDGHGYNSNGEDTYWNTNQNKGYVYEYVKTSEGDEVNRAHAGWRDYTNDSQILWWEFVEAVRTPESVSEDRLIDDLVFALRHQIANEFNRYQCYDDAGQPSLTSNFEQEVKYALNYMYEDAQNCGGKNVYALADQLEYYNARLHLVKPKVGDFIRMQGEKNKTYFSGSSSKTTYDMLEEQVETVDGKEVVKDPGASTIFYYDAEGKLVNYSSGLVFGYADEGDYAVKTELKENTDKVVPTVLFTDSRVTRFPAHRDEETGAILRDSVQVAHTYSVYMGPTENDKVLIAKKGTSAHVAHMGFPKPGDTGNYDSETEILLTKMNELPISVKKTGYSTFYCPVDAQLQNGNAYIAKVNEEEARITFTKLSDGRIPKNTPVLIESEEARAQGQTVTVIAKLRTDGAAYTPVASGSNDLKGGYYTVSFMKSADHATYDAVIERKAVDTHTYTLQNGTWLYFVGTKLQGFKARFELKDVAGNGSMSGVKEYTFIFNDEETGETKVVDAFGESKTDDVIYNLSGQRVNKAQKGLYIMNGKKVLVK